MKQKTNFTLLKTLCGIAGFVLIAALFSLTGFAESRHWANGDYEMYAEGDYQYILLTDEDLSADPNMESDGEGAYITQYTGTASSVAVPASLGGKTVKWIGHQAFKGNNAIQTVTINANIKSINVEAFAGCGGLQTVLIASETRVIYPNAFNGCSALKNVTFQKGSKLEKIYDGAFDGCISLIGFQIPDGVKEIYTAAFRNCDSLTEINIPDSVTYLGGAVFLSCDSLRSATIGSGVTELGGFEDCVSLETVSIGSSVRTIEDGCFANCGLLAVDVPDNVTAVGSRAFQNCGKLKTASVGDGVLSIGDSAFENDSALEAVKIGAHVRTIGEIAFKHCASLKSVVIPASVDSLGAAAFFGCGSLESAVIGNGVPTLGTKTVKKEWSTEYWGAFEDCTSLKRVYIGSGVKQIEKDCFFNSGLVSVEIPDNVETIGQCAFARCERLKSIKISKACREIPESCFVLDTALTDVSIGTGVITVGDHAFMKCTALKKVFIPSQVTSLGGGAFFGCTNLETAVIGNGVTSLTEKKFWTTLGSFFGKEFPYDLKKENWGMGQGDYHDTDCWMGVFEGCVNLKKVTLGSGLTSIGMDSFAGTAIERLTVPQKVSRLGTGAFAYAGPLKDLYFAGNWGSDIGSDLFAGVAGDVTIHHIAGKLGYDELPYNKKTYAPVIVSFDNNNDDVFAAPTEDQIISPEGDYVIEPIAPAALGYLFGGWYADQSCTKPWDFENTYVTNSVTLYAKWTSVNDAPPVRPENVTIVENAGRQIRLAWPAVDGAQSYNVYVNGVKVNTAPIAECAYTAEGLKYGATYEFVVKAVNAAGESEASIITAANTAEDPLREFEGHYYLAIDDNMSWSEAKAFAEAQGGYLMCISSQEEQDFAVSLLDGNGEKSSYWLGFTDETAEGEYVWINGEKTAFTNWQEGQPDNWEASEHYASLNRDGSWNDLPEANESTGLIIEWNSKADAYKSVSPNIPDHPADPELPELPEEATGVRGDADGDGKVSAKDARLALRAAAKLEQLPEEAVARCDLNGDGKVSAAEAREILRFSARLISTL